MEANHEMWDNDGRPTILTTAITYNDEKVKGRRWKGKSRRQMNWPGITRNGVVQLANVASFQQYMERELDMHSKTVSSENFL